MFEILRCPRHFVLLRNVACTSHRDNTERSAAVKAGTGKIDIDRCRTVNSSAEGELRPPFRLQHQPPRWQAASFVPLEKIEADIAQSFSERLGSTGFSG